MHPLIARFLDPKAALEVFDRNARGEGLQADERRFAEAARAHPELAGAIMAARDAARPGEDAENALILLGVQAAASGLPSDPVLGELVAKAQAAFVAEGATADQANQLIAGALVEEAFSGDGDPSEYDLDFVRETIDGLPALSKLDADRVDELLSSFTEATAAQNRPLAAAASEALARAAWSDGLAPITAEAVEEALDALDAGTSKTPTATMMEALLRYFMVHQLVGPLRLERLLDAVQAWATGRERSAEDDDENDDDDE